MRYIRSHPPSTIIITTAANKECKARHEIGGGNAANREHIFARTYLYLRSLYITRETQPDWHFIENVVEFGDLKSILMHKIFINQDRSMAVSLQAASESAPVQFVATRKTFSYIFVRCVFYIVFIQN